MKIDEFFSLETDPNNWILRKETPSSYTDKEGNEKDTISKKEWYFSNIKKALKRYLDESLTDPSNISDLLNRIEDVESKINLIKVKYESGEIEEE